PETHARTCLHTPGPRPSARSSAPSHLPLAGRSHHGEQLTHGSMTAWSDSSHWPVAHTECPTRAFQGMQRLHACWAYSLTAPHPPRDPPTGRFPAFPSPRFGGRRPRSPEGGVWCAGGFGWRLGRAQESGKIRPTRRIGG